MEQDRPHIMKVRKIKTEFVNLNFPDIQGRVPVEVFEYVEIEPQRIPLPDQPFPTTMPAMETKTGYFIDGFDYPLRSIGEAGNVWLRLHSQRINKYHWWKNNDVWFYQLRPGQKATIQTKGDKFEWFTDSSVGWPFEHQEADTLELAAEQAIAFLDEQHANWLKRGR